MSGTDADDSVEDEQPVDGQGSRREDEGFLVSEMNVHDGGRVTIPHRFRDRFNLGHHDIVDVLVLAGGTTFFSPDLPLDGSGRVRIPDRQRTIYDVEDGDHITFEVVPTTLTYEE